MPNYRRNRIPGGTYFFTVNLADRRSDLLTREITPLRAAIRATRQKRPFKIVAWVILPDHMHCIWTLPENDSDYSARWHAIKTTFTKSQRQPHQNASADANPKPSPIWQPRFWEHTIRDDRDLITHIDYIHHNPIKHGLATHPADWPYSTYNSNHPKPPPQPPTPPIPSIPRTRRAE
jgi:putative transposase